MENSHPGGGLDEAGQVPVPLDCVVEGGEVPRGLRLGALVVVVRRTELLAQVADLRLK